MPRHERIEVVIPIQGSGVHLLRCADAPRLQLRQAVAEVEQHFSPLIDSLTRRIWRVEQILRGRSRNGMHLLDSSPQAPNATHKLEVAAHPALSDLKPTKEAALARRP